MLLHWCISVRQNISMFLCQETLILILIHLLIFSNLKQTISKLT